MSTSAYVPFTVSNDLLKDADALREQAGRQGYLFFRGLVDVAALRQVRGDILALCENAGWLKPGVDPDAGISAEGTAHIHGDPAHAAVYAQIMHLERFHALAHHPALLGAMNTLFGEPTLVHPRNIARIIFPHAEKHTTPAHQDYIYIQGTPETWTAWMPLGDCPKELGSLAILPESHRQGIYPVVARLGAGGRGIEEHTLKGEWAASDFRAGDVVFFHSHVVHKGLPNLTDDKLRLSVDFRYQGYSQPVTEGSLLPHDGVKDWEAVYQGWTSPQYQYYWRGLPVNVVPFDMGLLTITG